MLSMLTVFLYYTAFISICYDTTVGHCGKRAAFSKAERRVNGMPCPLLYKCRSRAMSRSDSCCGYILTECLQSYALITLVALTNS